MIRFRTVPFVIFCNLFLLFWTFQSKDAYPVWTTTLFDQTIYARQYAVACDGVTPNADVALNTAIASSSGLKLQLPAGNCLINKTVKVPGGAGYNVQGYGPGYGGTTTPTQLTWNGSNTSLATSQAGSGTTLTFASNPITAGIVYGMVVTDTTTPGNLPNDTIVLSVTSTTVTCTETHGISANCAASVASGDTLKFSPAMISLQGVRDSYFGNFGLLGSTVNPPAIGIQSLATTGFVSTGNTYEHVIMNGINGTGLGKGWAFQAGSGGDTNNDVNLFIKDIVANHAIAAWSLEHTQTKTHTFLDCSIAGVDTAGTSLYGVATNLGAGFGGSFKWIGGAGGQVGIDFYLQVPDDYVLIEGWNSEGSGRLLRTNGIAVANYAVTINAVRWAANGINADHNMIDFESLGPLNVYNSLLGDGGNPVQIKFVMNQTAAQVANIKGNQFIESQTSGTFGWFTGTNQLINVTSSPGLVVNAEGNNVTNGSGTAIKLPDLVGHGPLITTAAIGAGSCNSTGMAVAGDQNYFHLTCGSTAGTSATITWPVARIFTPICEPPAPYQTTTTNPTITTNNGTTFTFSWTGSVASSAWDVHCDGV